MRGASGKGARHDPTARRREREEGPAATVGRDEAVLRTVTMPEGVRDFIGRLFRHVRP
jgi:hypothetical protein